MIIQCRAQSVVDDHYNMYTTVRDWKHHSRLLSVFVGMEGVVPSEVHKQFDYSSRHEGSMIARMVI